MYRVNPFTYVVEGFLGTSLANAPVTCANNEIVPIMAPENSTCEEYLRPMMEAAGGALIESNGSECMYCPMENTNQFLDSLNVSFSNRWRDFGFMWVYICFNIAAAFFFYWLVRVPKGGKVKKA